MVVEDGLLEEVWVCKCPLCRVTARPLLSYFIRRFVRRWDVMPEETGGKEAGVGVGGSGGGAQEGISELKELVEALKDAVVDLRAALSEMTNPMNLMRRYGELEELEALKRSVSTTQAASARAPIPVSAQDSIVSESSLAAQSTARKEGIEKPLEREAARTKEESIPKRVKEVKGIEVAKPASKEGRKVEGEAGGAVRIAGRHGLSVAEPLSSRQPPRPSEVFSEGVKKFAPRIIKFIKTLYLLDERLPVPLVSKYIDLLEAVGLLRSEEVEVAKKLYEVVDEGLKRGLSVDEQILTLYILIKALGVESAELENEALKIIMKSLRNRELRRE